MLAMLSRALPFATLVAVWPTTRLSPSQNRWVTDCAVELDSVRAIVSGGYAGYREKTTAATSRFTMLDDSVKFASRRTSSAGECTVLLRRWIGFFRDPHMTVVVATEAKPAAVPTPAPSLMTFDRQTAVLRLPSFGANWKRAIDSLILVGSATLQGHDVLVIDVRGNDGGGQSSYDAVLPLLATSPMHRQSFDVWASTANSGRIRAFSARFPPSVRAEMETLLQRMEAQPNAFVPELLVETVAFDSTFTRPRAVAVLFDHECVSACELFVLDARASRKVTTVGTSKSGGVVDYGNRLPVGLPSGERQLWVPISRARRLPAEAYDNVGIAPSVLVPPSEPDPLRFAVGFMKKQSPRSHD